MNRERQEQLKRLAWSDETMRMINDLTPEIKGKAFDPGWFVLRQRLDEASQAFHRLAEVEEELAGLKARVHLQETTQDRQPTLGDYFESQKELVKYMDRCSAYESAMHRDRAPAWEKQLKELSVELRSASEYPAISDTWREDLQMASIKLFEMATVYTHKCNFVPCKLALNEAKKWLKEIAPPRFAYNEDFEKALANITATLQSLEATEP